MCHFSTIEPETYVLVIFRTGGDVSAFGKFSKRKIRKIERKMKESEGNTEIIKYSIETIQILNFNNANRF